MIIVINITIVSIILPDKIILPIDEHKKYTILFYVMKLIIIR